MIINKINNEKVQPVELREVIATPENAPFIVALQTTIRENALKDKNGEPVFATDSLEFILSVINSKRGEVVLFFNGDDFVSYFELTCPDNPNDLEGKYGISTFLPGADISNMGVAESLVVVPKYRGNNLQLKMFYRMEEIAEQRGITSLMGTVHPENIYSCQNFDLANYQTITLFKAPYGVRLLKYKSLLRKEYDSDNNEKGKTL